MAQPDIHYFPDLEKYKARTKRRLESEKIDPSLPTGFPEELRSSLAWDGAEYAGAAQGTPDWVYRLNDGELQEIDAALRHFLSTLLRADDGGRRAEVIY